MKARHEFDIISLSQLSCQILLNHIRSGNSNFDSNYFYACEILCTNQHKQDVYFKRSTKTELPKGCTTSLPRFLYVKPSQDKDIQSFQINQKLYLVQALKGVETAKLDEISGQERHEPAKFNECMLKLNIECKFRRYRYPGSL